MSQGHGWRGMAPLALGVAGLLLLAFGATWYEGSEEINARARTKAEQYEKALRRARTPETKEMIVAQVEEELTRMGKPLEPEILIADNEPPADRDLAAAVHDRVYDAWRDHRDPGGLIGGRFAFYGGLVLLLTAGVLLYRRTPRSMGAGW